MINWIYDKVSSFIRFLIFFLTLFLLAFGGLLVVIGQVVLSVAEKTIIYSLMER